METPSCESEKVSIPGLPSVDAVKSAGKIMDLFTLFKDRYTIDPITGCWLWQGARNNKGYGVIRHKGRNQYVHRVSYQRFKGFIPKKLELDHLCHKGTSCTVWKDCPHRFCINPDHLQPVTHLINMKRGSRAAKTHCPQGHPYNGENLYIRPEHGKNRERIARMCKFCQRKNRKRIR